MDTCFQLPHCWRTPSSGELPTKLNGVCLPGSHPVAERRLQARPGIAAKTRPNECAFSALIPTFWLEKFNSQDFWLRLPEMSGLKAGFPEAHSCREGDVVGFKRIGASLHCAVPAAVGGVNRTPRGTTSL